MRIPCQSPTSFLKSNTFTIVSAGQIQSKILTKDSHGPKDKGNSVSHQWQGMGLRKVSPHCLCGNVAASSQSLRDCGLPGTAALQPSLKRPHSFSFYVFSPLPSFFFLKIFFSCPSYVLSRERNAVYLQEEVTSSKRTKCSPKSHTRCLAPFQKGTFKIHSLYSILCKIF